MAGPARSGALIYAKNLGELAAFYVEVVGMTEVHATHELVVLNTADLQVVIHKMPPEAKTTTQTSAPPDIRESAVKLFFSVDSIASAKARAEALGGEIFPGVWHGPDFRVANARDIEGNIFQVREASR